MHRHLNLVFGTLASMTLAAFATPALAQGSPGSGTTPSTRPDQAPPTVTAPAGDGKVEAISVPDRAFVVMETNKGTIVLELNGEKAPLSVMNFLRYVESGYYDGTIFHRVIPSFMIQGGGFDTTGAQKETEAPIKNEWQNGLKNSPGTIAFARTANPDSATSQFFINTGDNSALKDAAGVSYAVFGKVVAGMDTVTAIKSMPTGTRTLMARSGSRTIASPSRDVPLEIVEIVSVRRVSDEDAKAKIDSMAKPDGDSGAGAGDAPKAPTPPARGAPKAPASGAGAPNAPGTGAGAPGTTPPGR